MFKQARLRLTGWYLLIIMMVSLAFSGVIYRASTFELNRFARAQQNRFALRPSPPPFDEDLLSEAQARILKSLVFINLGIFSVASLLGYYLSGKTLEPISEMMDEQYRFVSDASHELKTPITTIKSTLEVTLRDKKMKLGEAQQALAASLEEVNQLQKLAEGLLELSSNHGELKMIPVELDRVIDEAIKTIEPVASLHKIEIVSSLAKTTIMGESESLRRAIVIVLDNAIKYSKAKSKIYISTKVSGKEIVLRIRDEGIGIEENEIPMIFHRFYRGDKARGTDGHGIGLSIAKKIVESQKGAIRVESKKGRGTTISLVFPYSARIQN